MNLCACGCGTEVNGTWARGHSRRGRPDEARAYPVKLLDPFNEDIEDIGIIDPDDETPPAPPPASPESTPPPTPPEPEDTGPAHATKEWRSKGKTSTSKRAPKITVGVRQDIHAKISLPLEVAGRLWQVRDPWCGGAFVDQRAEIADALTDIVCDSADLVNFFTGPAGGFMKYLKLGAALWPVAEMIGAHHISKAIDEGNPDANQPVYQA